MLKFMRISVFCLLSIIFLAGSVTAATSVVINELMASNKSCIQDSQGQYDDWIELYNYGATSVNIGGMYLTDNLSDPTMWQIPASTIIPARGYLLIWADDDTSDAGLHANFKLDIGGEEVLLLASNGTTLVDRITFSDQRDDISFGRFPDAGYDLRYFDSPSPGSENQGGFPGIVADTTFSSDRGFYDASFDVTISSKTAGATIMYTTDGSTPTETNGQIYAGPIPISTTTCLRAAAFKTDWLPTNVDTHTYIFLDDVIEQPQYPSGYPTSGWGHAGPDYEMDPVVVSDYSDTIKDDLKSIPTLSLVMDIDDWFGNKGIYVNESQDGTERVVSMEWIDPNSGDDFQLNCAIAMQGGVSGGGTSLNRWKMDKLSMRVRFKPNTDNGTPTGGPSNLNYKVFDNSPVDSFDTLVLDARMGNTWPYGGRVTDHGSRPWISGRSIYQPDVAQYTRDQFVADIQNALGGYGHHGRHAHIYINGLYWGIYNVHERPDHRFAASYLGGDEDDYDCIKHDSSQVINGSNETYLEMINIIQSGVTSDDNYQLIQEYLDVNNFIDYIIPNYYVGNYDWSHKNWYATHNTVDPNGRWRFHHWDGEHLMENLYEDVTGLDQAGSPTRIQQRLAQNAEYRLLFADHVHRHFFNDGDLTPEGATALYQVRLDDVNRAVVGESARWGDNQIRQNANIRYMRDPHWILERDYLLGTYFPNRTGIVLDQFRARGWYPNIDAPVFYINGYYQHGGQVEDSDELSMTANSGEIYYTLDGSDPRIPGAEGPTFINTTILSENAAKKALVPAESISEDWKSDLSFDDSSWTGGTGGVGYETGSGYQDYFDIDVEAEMYNGNTSCYIRIPFTFENSFDDFDFLMLNIRYDDGFIAYINGIEVARSDNAPSDATWNSMTTGSHDDSQAVVFESFGMFSLQSYMQQGQNILAIHGLNYQADSSDFLISAELVGVHLITPNERNISPSAILYSEPIAISNSTKVKARAMDGGIWSALNEATYAVGPVAENLRITEIMYHPLSPTDTNDPNEEFIELKNIGSETINLSLVKFTNGIDFTFPGIELVPDEFVVVVEDINAFKSLYGTEVDIAGQYTGRLANNGERIRLEDAIGRTILDFSYKDSWYDNTDGQGYSLTLKNPLNPNLQSWGDKNAWRSSDIIYGSPGWDDSN